MVQEASFLQHLYGFVRFLVTGTVRPQAKRTYA
jgi:hypothetical protein